MWITLSWQYWNMSYWVGQHHRCCCRHQGGSRAKRDHSWVPWGFLPIFHFFLLPLSTLTIDFQTPKESHLTGSPSTTILKAEQIALLQPFLKLKQVACSCQPRWIWVILCTRRNCVGSVSIFSKLYNISLNLESETSESSHSSSLDLFQKPEPK